MTMYALVGASEFNSEQFSARNGAGAFDAVIAVDGGFASLAAAGCVPDLALGDFDSLGYVPEGVEVLVFPPEKDASDMELALGEVLSRRVRVTRKGKDKGELTVEFYSEEELRDFAARLERGEGNRS